MCGVIGISVGWQGPLIKEGQKILEHRGPDDGGVFANDFVTLAHQRLAIIDLTPSGHQPMTLSYNNQDAIISFNGEIYNYQELKNDLVEQGCHFFGGSDTEVILKGYAKEGVAFFGKMRGMWALAIYDALKNEIVLSRDHFGIKPLYYALENNKLSFASEVKALKKIAGPLTPNTRDYYQFYNLGYFWGEATCFKEVKKVLPGEVLVWNLATHKLAKSCLVLPSLPKKEINFEEAVASMDEVLEDSVRQHYIADVPVGLLLSGGTDSSLIAALSKKIGKNPVCYHIAVSGSIDTEYATKIADQLGLSLISRKFNNEALKTEYEKMGDWLDQPSSDVSLLPTALVYKLIGKESKVVLSGEGGDELFGGYLRHQRLASFGKITNPDGSNLLDQFYLPSDFGLQTLNPILRRLQEQMPGDLIDVYLRNTKTLGFPIDQEQIRQKLFDFYNNHPFKNVTSPNLFFDQFLYLPDSLMYKNDITSMVSSIEARVPLVDKAVLLSASVIPAKFRLSPQFLRKKILKTILKKYLPTALVDRPKKGFGFSFDKLEADFLLADYQKATKFHLQNARAFGVGLALQKILQNTNPQVVCKKFPRFAFSLITSHKVML